MPEFGPKDSQGKLEWAALPWGPLMEVVKVFEYGATPDKYGDYWTYCQGIPARKLYSATLRHLVKWFWFGEETDPESNCHHLAHVAANALMMLASHGSGCAEADDRPIMALTKRIAASIKEPLRVNLRGLNTCMTDHRKPCRRGDDGE